MLGSSKIMAFVPTADPKRARSFYEQVLGLRFVSEEAAIVHDSGMGRARYRERRRESRAKRRQL